MKKIIGPSLLCLLAACSSPKNCPNLFIPSADQAFYTQKMSTVPWPWVQIIPSERAAGFEFVDFSYIDHLIRNGMIGFPAKFEKISLVLVDYNIVPAEEHHLPRYGRTGLKFSKKYLSVPKYYLLEIRFYGNRQQPPAEPLYMGTITFAPKGTHFNEALPYMVDSLMLDLGLSASKRIILELSPRTMRAAPHKKQPAPAPAQPAAPAPPAPAPAPQGPSV